MVKAFPAIWALSLVFSLGLLVFSLGLENPPPASAQREERSKTEVRFSNGTSGFRTVAV